MNSTNPSNIYPYPFEEFAEHFDDLTDGDWLERGSFIIMLAITCYMEEKYSDPEEAEYKASRFSQILLFLWQRVDDFHKGAYVVDRFAKVRSVDNQILKAVHEWFTSTTEPVSSPSPEEIMQLAEKYREKPSDGK